MVTAGISCEERTNIHFIDTKTAKMNRKNYSQLLDDQLLPYCRLHPTNDYMFYEGGAPPHTSKVTEAYLGEAKF